MNVSQLCKYLVVGSTLLVANTSIAAGLLTPVNSGLPALQIIEHHVEVVIDDGYATTQIEQVFHNPHNQALEAVYSFPVPSKAAVGEFAYWIDGVPVVGEVLEKKQARQVYEEEKAAGRETAIAEKDSYKTFDIAVSPVRALDDVRIRLVYVQPTNTDAGVGRYLYPLEEGGVDEEKIAFWSRNDAVEGAFSFNLKLRSSYPIDGLRLPNHPQALVNQLSTEEWEVNLANGTATTEPGLHAKTDTETIVETVSTNNAAMLTRLDKDIVAYWRHAPGLPGSLDMITQRTDNNSRGTFMLTLTPGDDLGLVSEGRDWIFVLDISGSMEGKYQTLVEGIRQGMGKLKPEDRFRIVLFNDGALDLSNGYQPVMPETVNLTLQQLEQTQPNGGTNLYAGLKEGLSALDADRPSAIVLVTDGVANVGTTEKKAFLELMEQTDVRLFSFIMGNSSNRPLLEGMTKVSHGFFQEVSNSDDIVGQLMLATEKLTHHAFRDVEFKINGIKVSEITPQEIGTLYSGQQLHLFGHHWQGGIADIVLTGKIGAETKRYETRVTFPETANLHPEIERLWAYASIENLLEKQDYFGKDADIQQAITDLATEHGLVTEYTSMVVMRDEQFAQRGIKRSNSERVALEQQARQSRLSQAVSNNRVDTQQPLYTSNRPAIGGGGGAVGPWILILLPLIWWRRRAAPQIRKV